MHEAIKAWLNNNGDYGRGAALYFVHGDNTKLKDLFLKGFSEFNKIELNKALRALYDKELGNKQPDVVKVIAHAKPVANAQPIPAIVKPPVVIPVTAPTPEIVQPSEPEKIVVDPQLLQVTDDAAKTAWKEMMNMRAVLFSKTKVEAWQDENEPNLVSERGRLALDILAFNKKVVNPSYNKLHDLKTTGRINNDQPVLADFELVPDAQLKHTIDNLRKALGKNKGKLSKLGATPERVEKIQQQELLLNALLERWELIKN